MKLLLIAAGGAVGAVLRYAVSGLAYRYMDASFPWGTLAVNLIGSFVLGLLWAFSERVVLPPSLAPFLMVGVLGAFTTFSTYSVESFNLLRDGEIRLGLTNIFASNLLGLGAVFLGFVTARYLFALVRQAP